MAYIPARPVAGSAPWDLEDQFEAIEAKLAPHVIHVTETTQAALIAARDELIASVSGSIGPASKILRLGPGVWNITQNDALMLPGDGTVGFDGVIIEGSGIGTTTIVFSPTVTSDSKMSSADVAQGDASVGNLFSANSRTRWLTVRNLTIESGNSLANAFWFKREGSSSNQNQAMRFRSINFKGSFQRCFGMDSVANGNQNSEVSFVEITTNGSPNYHDAFLQIGGISSAETQQVQFLNYWMDKCQIYSAGGDTVHIRRGGYLHWANTSWSAMSSANPAMCMLRIGSMTNTMSVTSYRCSFIRSEPKALDHEILNSDLSHGNIVFDQCSDQANLGGNAAAYDWAMYRIRGQRLWNKNVHVNLTFRNCHNAGYVNYDPDAAVTTGIAVIGYVIMEGCYWYRGNDGAQSIPTPDQGATSPVLRWSGSKAPGYWFRACNHSDTVAEYTNKTLAA